VLYGTDKKITTKEENFARNIAISKTQVESYKLADYSISAYSTMANEASKIFNKPHIQAHIKKIKDEIANTDIYSFMWDRDKATEKLLNILDRVDLDSEKQFCGNGKIYLNTIHKLNTMWQIDKLPTQEQPTTFTMSFGYPKDMDIFG